MSNTKQQQRGVLRIDNFLYDSAALARIHPGGEVYVLQAEGTDATALFNTSHRRPFPHDDYVKYRVDESSLVDSSSSSSSSSSDVIIPPKITSNQDWSTYWELCKAVKPILDTKENNFGFAPWHYYVKVAALLFTVLYMDYYFVTRGRTVLLSIFLAWIRASIGFCIMHDANHGAVSKNPFVNRFLGLSLDYLGGSSIGWMINHNVIHHTVCNDTVRDHDLESGALRLKKMLPWLPVYKFQHIYVWFVELLFLASHMPYYWVFNWTSPESRKKNLQPAFNLTRTLSFYTFVRLSVLLFADPTWANVAMIALEYSVFGWYLAFFFLLNHNFVGVLKDDVDYTNHSDFVKNQVESSSNFGYDNWIFVNGGLNIQIEHHLFPRVSHCHYAKLLPVVKEFCEKRKIRYVHFPTLWQNIKSTYLHLKGLGQKPAAE